MDSEVTFLYQECICIEIGYAGVRELGVVMFRCRTATVAQSANAQSEQRGVISSKNHEVTREDG